MACADRECRRCRHAWFSNTLTPEACELCGSEDVLSWFDEEWPDDEREDDDTDAACDDAA